ncbi:MAG: PocR ligand-binding domain-containing protein [Desulfatiglandaceae bacterium]|jgi:ligand-binding sensor protein
MGNPVTTLYDIKSKEEWQRILDSVCRELGIPSAITDKENTVLEVGGQRNPLCSKIRSNPEASSFICSQAQQFMAEAAKETRRPIIDFCDAGMLKLVIPVFSQAGFAGTLTACGARIEGQELEAFLIEKSTKLKEAEIEALTKRVPEGDRSKISAITQRIYHQLQNTIRI